jgi:phage shock protein PspC (stress-responsive transcriptional regulator)
MIGGVASGLADYFEIDVTIIRVLFVLAVFIPVTFPVILFSSCLTSQNDPKRWKKGTFLPEI